MTVSEHIGKGMESQEYKVAIDDTGRMGGGFSPFRQSREPHIWVGEKGIGGVYEGMVRECERFQGCGCGIFLKGDPVRDCVSRIIHVFVSQEIITSPQSAGVHVPR